MLADLPCSGLGVLRKKNDLKYRMNLKQQRELVKLQRQILDTVWQYVKPGGVLMYSTCTINRRENQEACDWICGNFPFVLEESRQLLPRQAQMDGFFYARLRRVESV